jgi:DNA-directed RNA polymerase subunit alpha
MTVENTRVGQVTDLDKLTLEVYTNKTIDPDEAVSLAAKVLSEHLALFIDLSENAQNAEVMVAKEEEQGEDVLKRSIEDLELSVRSFNCLRRNNINTVEEIISKSLDEMSKVRNLGKKSLDEIQKKVEDLGLKFRNPEE